MDIWALGALKGPPSWALGALEGPPSWALGALKGPPGWALGVPGVILVCAVTQSTPDRI